MRKMIALTMLSGLLLISAAATAHERVSDNGETVSVKVSYGDLNLSSDDGGRVMLQRIRHAAKTVCGPEEYDPMWRRYVYGPCVQKTMNRAVARLDSPIVTALNGAGRSNPGFALASR